MSNRYVELPTPAISFIDSLKTTKASESVSSDQRPETPSTAKTISTASPTKPLGKIRRDSLLDAEADPWASPAVPKPQTKVVQNEITPPQETTTARPVARSVPSRTTSAFTTQPEGPSTSSRDSTTVTADDPSVAAVGWDNFGTPSPNFSNGLAAGLGSGGFGGEDPNLSGRPNRALGGGRTTSRGVEETVTISLIPEKEGIFMFQHRNYEVKSARRGSSVVRRYSDFVWLLDCLHKRYPFRQLPLLPPKTLAGKQFTDLKKRALLS